MGDEVFAEYDTSDPKDDMLSFDEFSAWWNTPYGDEEEETTEDQEDGEGEVDGGMDYLQTMFNEYDVDGDSMLSKVEFIDFMFSFEDEEETDGEEDMDEGEEEEQDDGEIDIQFGDDGSVIIGGN